MQRLDESSDTGVVVNLGDWLQKYAFDVIGNITFGKRFGFLDHGEDIGGLIQALEKRRVFTSLSGVYPFLHGLTFRVMSRLPGSGAAGFAYLSEFGQAELARHKAKAGLSLQADDGPIPQVDRFLNGHSEKPESFPMHAVLAHSMGNIFAGSDTTGISLTAIVNNLCRNPETVEKLRAEIEGHVSNTRSPEALTFKEAQSMPYLNAVIKESLRLHPATGLPLFRKVPAGGASIIGQYFPEGATVGINTWVAHYNEDAFGPDAPIFRPERWLEADSRQLSLMEQYNFPFGLGARNCLGKNISMLEMSKVIPQLIRNFDFQLEDPTQPLQCENFWFVKQTNFRCQVIRRKAP
ncbi:cytochrome P450 [Viridothelium virens]|uniref:Cytochrome P450 n=1 Tax=Viridothelium virens TaxID=1048519 RepID=A0A6A6HGT4_VIRVR|nr:cytochrome P450 [Viridothelium virens]